MARIGILTFHHIINEGAILQAYSLVTALKKKFPEHDVEIIDFRLAVVERAYFKTSFLSTKRPRVFIRNAFRHLKFKNFIAENLPLSKDNLTSDGYEQSIEFLKNKYDLIVVGSDEVWKLEKGIYSPPFPNIYWLGKELDCKKIGYAASANKLEYKSLDDSQTNFMKQALNNFDLIGVRDNHTFDMIHSWKIVAADKLEKVPDPTLLNDVPLLKEEVKSHMARWGIDFTRPLLGVTFSLPAIDDRLIPIYRKMGYQIVGFSSSSRNVDINLTGRLNPFQWAHAFSFLNFCFTNLFHGSIYCIKSGVPFLGFDYFNSSQYDSKMRCLLDEFDLMKCYVPIKDVEVDIEELIIRSRNLPKDFDKEAISKKLEQMRSKGNNFLIRAKELLK